MLRLQNAQAPPEETAPEAIDDQIDIETFQKVKLRTARVVAAEAIPKAKKLLKLQVDLGNEKRQIVAGIAQHYSPEELIGKTVVLVANLQPATIRGVESCGMLLAVHDQGRLILVAPEQDAAPGQPVS